MKIVCSLVVCLVGVGAAAASDEKPTIRVYTNEDLDRLRDRRGETGITSEVAASQKLEKPRAAERSSARGEAFWRREGERERRRLEPLQRRIAALEEKLQERGSRARRGFAADPLLDTIAAQIQALRSRIREEQSRFEDRARREGALPGWLRQ